MKKLLLVLLILAFILPSTVAFASNIDWDSMSDQEIATAINEGRAVIASRMPDSPDHLTVANQNGIEIYLTRQYKIEEYYDGKFYIKLQAVVVNGTDGEINITNNGCCINGWAVDTEGIIEIPANRMKKDDFTFCLSDADISTMEEIKDMDFAFRAYSAETYSTIVEFDNFTYVR